MIGLPVTKEYVLKKYGEYSIFKHYISNFNTLDKLFISELRADKNPSCVISEYNGRLHYYDFGTGDRLDVFSYLQKRFNISYKEVLYKIEKDFSFGIQYKTIPIYKVSKEQSSIIAISVRKWNKDDKSYWYDKYGLDFETLNRYRVYPIDHYSINNCNFKADKLSYAYYFGVFKDIHRYKIYQPNNDRFKWISNTTSEVIQGFEQLVENDLLILTSSLKDVMVLNEAGYNACALQAESTIFTKQHLQKLIDKTKAKNIVSIYDNDEAGIKYAQKLKNEYGIHSIFMPEGSKDPAEFVDNYDYFSLLDYVESKL